MAMSPPQDGEPVDHAELVRGDGTVMLGSASAAELQLPVGGASVRDAEGNAWSVGSYRPDA